MNYSTLTDTLTTCPFHHPLRFPSLLPHIVPGNRVKGRGVGRDGWWRWWIVTICQWHGDQWSWRGEMGVGGGGGVQG